MYIKCTACHGGTADELGSVRKRVSRLQKGKCCTAIQCDTRILKELTYTETVKLRSPRVGRTRPL